jgi:hypothetical protein
MSLATCMAFGNLWSAVGGVDAVSGWASPLEIAAAIAIAVGIVCQLLHRRLPGGLGTSLFAAAATLGIALAAVSRPRTESALVHLAFPLASALCALWAFFAWLTRARGPAVKTASTPSASATFLAWSLVCGILAGVLAVYVLVSATWSRLLDSETVLHHLTAAGLLNLACLLLACLFWINTVSRPQQPVMLLLSVGLHIWWTSLMIAPTVGPYDRAIVGDKAVVAWLSAVQPAWWTWTFQMQIGLAALLIGAAVIQDVRYRGRRRRAWPDRLDDLLEPYSRWPGYIRVEAIIAAVVLILGVYHIVQPYPVGWQLSAANFLISLAAGVACLFMTYRRWSGNTAGLGVALTTLAAVALACLIATAFMPWEGSVEYARRIPILDNAILFALAAAIVFWSWLTGFWDQQLLDGRPWTTAGRMIPFARRAAFLLSALAVLVSFRMALWPRQVLSNVDDGSPGRLCCGLGAMSLLALVGGRKARKEDSTADATFAIAHLIAAMVFVFVRLPPSERRSWGWLLQYETVLLSFVCLPLLVAAEALHKSRWRSFSTPLWLLALLILPLRVLIQLLPSSRLPAEWVRPMALAVLGAVYSFAGSRESRRAILVLGGVLLLAALSTFCRSYGRLIMP